MTVQGFRFQPGNLLRSDSGKFPGRRPASLWHVEPAPFARPSRPLSKDQALGHALTAKVADIAAPAVTETAQLLELLDVTPPYFALQDIQVSNTETTARVVRESILRGEVRSALSCQELCRHAANLGVTAVAAVNPSKRKTYCLAFYGQHKLLPHTGEDNFPDLSEHTEVAMKANVTRFSGSTAAVDINVYTSSVPGAANFNQHYAIVKVRYMLVAEEEFEAQMAGTLSPEAVADYFAHAPLAASSPYIDPVYLEDIAAPEPDVRIGHMCIDNPCMVKGHQFGLPVAVVAGNVFDTISMFGPTPDERLNFTLVSGTLKCSRMVQLGERVTIRTERPSPRKFMSEVLDKDGASICRFNLDVALH